VDEENAYLNQVRRKPMVAERQPGKVLPSRMGQKVALSLRKFMFSLVLDSLPDWFLWSPQPLRYMLAESQGFHLGQKRAGIAKRA